MIKLLEKELLLKCRKEDLNLIKELIPECETEFAAIMKREVNQPSSEEGGAHHHHIHYETKLTLKEDEFLKPEEGGECGGIILTNTNGRIVCNNTLKSRLDLCFEELLPHIRQLLFPVPEPEVPADKVEEHK